MMECRLVSSRLQFPLGDAEDRRTGSIPSVSCVSSGIGGLGFASILSSSSRVAKPIFFIAEVDKSEVPVDRRHFKLHKVAGDGKCMFRSIVQGVSRNKGVYVSPRDEEREADELRQAVYDAICRDPKRAKEFKEATQDIEASGEGPMFKYCARLLDPKFWGGTPELLVLSKMLKVPIQVYIPPEETKWGGDAFKLLAEFGTEYKKPGKRGGVTWKGRKPVRLSFSNSNHYDLLLSRVG